MRLLASLAILALMSAPATATESATVTLDVDLNGTDYKVCHVAVAPGANGGAVLDAAVASGCLLEWNHDSFDGFGRYVTSIDYIASAFATYWALYEDGQYANVGIDGMSFADGDTLRLNYEQWVVAA